MLDDRSPVVIVGTAPSSSGAPAWDAGARSTRRLARLAGCDPRELGRIFGLANLLAAWDPPWERPTDKMLRAAARSFVLTPGFRFVLAGSEVAAALGRRALPRARGVAEWAVGGPPLLRWYLSHEGSIVAVVPHPSRRNKWYNAAPSEEVPDGGMTARERLVSDFLRSCAHRGVVPASAIWGEASSGSAPPAE